MPYERSQSKLERFAEEVLGRQEIQEGLVHLADLEAAYLKEQFLGAGLEAKAPRIWDAASTEIEAYDELEHRNLSRLAELRADERKLRRSYLRVLRVPKWGLIAFLAAISPVLLLPLLLIFNSVLVSVELLPSSVTVSPGNILSGNVFEDAGITQSIAALLFLVLVLLIYIAICRKLYRRYSEAKRHYESHLSEIESELNSDVRERGLEVAEQKVEHAVIEKGLLPELRSMINGLLVPSYDADFAGSAAPALTTEGLDQSYDISTGAEVELGRLLHEMPFGSIGITGPQGAGKSTLLESYCGSASMPELKGRPVLSVMTETPLENYDARQFVLHIFSSVCQRMLEIKGRRAWTYRRASRKIQEPPSLVLRAISREAWASVLFGSYLIAFGFLVRNYDRLAKLLISSSFEFFLSLGLFFVLLGLVGLQVRLERSLQRWRQLWFERRLMKGLYGDDPLVAEAYKWLDDIRIQQTLASDWSGSIVPVVAQTVASADATNMGPYQKSLREIVDGYRQYLRMAANRYQIIVGIDDLDKTQSVVQAQRILDDIKALFGLEGCYYLITVPEGNRQSSIRSLDAVVRVNYLKLEEAWRLLRSRMVGVPAPFLDLCFCIAGGLPRDLVRAMRLLVLEHNQSNTEENSLSRLCRAMIRSDLYKVLRETKAEAKDIALKPYVDQLFSRIYRLESLLESTDYFPGRSSDLLQTSRDLIASANREVDWQAGPAEITTQRERIDSLSAGLGVYVYYSLTVLEFFGRESLEMETLRTAERSGALDQLAKSRQDFNVSVTMAKSGISDFRDAYGVTESEEALRELS